MLPLAFVLAAYVAGWYFRRRHAGKAGDPAGDKDSALECASAAGTGDGPAVTAGGTLQPGRPPEHPFAEAIEQLSQQPPPLQLPPRPCLQPAPPLGSGKEDYVFISTMPHLAAAAMELYEQDRIALDVEHHAQHTYAGITCLLQLSTGTKDYLIDCLALPRDEVRCLLAPVLSNPRICKVVHGGGNDVAWLQRDFGLFLVNIFDTEKACQVLGFQQRNLGMLLHCFCGVSIDKSLGQRADWRQRPLPPHLVEYARRDVHHLLDIADHLGQLLLQAAAPVATSSGTEQQTQPAGHPPQRHQPPPSVVDLSSAAQQALQAAMADHNGRLHRAVHRSQAVTLSLHQPTPPAAAVAAAAVTLMRRHVGEALEHHAKLTPEQVHQMETVADCIHALASWRDAAARAADEGLQCLLPDGVLLALAEAAAASVAPGASNLRGRHQEISKQQLLDLLAAELDEQQREPAAAAATAEDAAGGAASAGCDAVGASGSSSCGCFPRVLQQQAGQVAELLSEAAAGQRPWVCAEVQELLQAAAGGILQGAGGNGGGKPHKPHDPAAFRQRLAERFSCKSTVYENARMYSKDGELLCHTDKRKLLWYLKKGLAEKMSDDPLCVRLTFQHKTGDQQQGTSEFYTVEKANRCVACGEEGHYLRYRVVPAAYRKAMPVSLKSHRSHDVVLLCVSCHEMAQGAAERLKRTLADEMGIPLVPPLPKQQQQQAQRKERTPEEEAAEAGAAAEAAAAKPDLHPYNVRRSALAMQRYSHQMPEAKRRQLEQQIRHFLGSIGNEGPLTQLELYGGLLAGLGSKTRRRTLRRWVKQGRQLPPELAAEAAAAAAGPADAAEGDGEEASKDGAAEEEQAAAGEQDEGQAEQGGAGADTLLTEPDAEQGPANGSNSSGSSGGAQAPGGQQQKAETALGLGDLRNTGHAWHGQQVVERLMAEGGEQALLGLCQRFRQTFVETLQPQASLPVVADCHGCR
ncbi:hypothetical protein ABPG75_009780 [Micractinium tetrahymenae]